MNSTKQERVESCNKLLRAIGDCGRRFFYHGPRVEPGCNTTPRYAYFELRRGAVYLIDDYSQKAIYTAWTRDEWRGFSHGGTLRSLIIKLSDFIRTGSSIAPGHFGPWPEWTCGGDLWGYGPDMVKVRRAAVEFGIVRFEHPRHQAEYCVETMK